MTEAATDNRETIQQANTLVDASRSDTREPAGLQDSRSCALAALTVGMSATTRREGNERRGIITSVHRDAVNGDGARIR